MSDHEVIQLELTYCLDLDELVGRVRQALRDEDTIVELVKLLDERCENWDVTLGLYEYFKQQRDVFDALPDDEDD